MESSVKSTQIVSQRADCLIVGVHEKRKLSPSAKILDSQSGGVLSKILKRGDLDGSVGQSLILHDLPEIASPRVLLIGAGPEKKLTARQYQQLSAGTFDALARSGAKSAVSYLLELDVKDQDIAAKTRMAVQTTLERNYRFDQLKSDKNDKPPKIRSITFDIAGKRDLKRAELAHKQASAIAAGTELARDLGNLPGNICTPSYLANQAKKLAAASSRLTTTILGQKEMEKLGMGALLSVAKGSRQPAKLIVMQYKGASSKSDQPIVLVGKGITFDSGGISIKPSAAMDEMKFDMCGAASVFGTMKALTELNPGINVVGIVPSCENLPDGAANKPGDIVTSMAGKTIEVLNTDAEGRLILCDALTYSEKFKPRVVIDIATLTGACVIALGKHASGLLGNDENLTRDLIKTGEACGDRVWQLPLWDEYQDQIKSNFADMANIGGRDAGTITAACFLSRFTENLKWAHLDIAGTAWLSGAEKGATGRPVPLLTSYILSKSK